MNLLFCIFTLEPLIPTQFIFSILRPRCATKRDGIIAKDFEIILRWRFRGGRRGNINRGLHHSWQKAISRLYIKFLLMGSPKHSGQGTIFEPGLICMQNPMPCLPDPADRVPMNCFLPQGDRLDDFRSGCWNVDHMGPLDRRTRTTTSTSFPFRARALQKMSASKPYAHAQYGKLVLVVVLVLPYTINQLIKTSTWEDKGNQFNWLQTRFLWITDTEKCFLKTQYRQTPSINYG